MVYFLIRVGWLCALYLCLCALYLCFCTCISVGFLVSFLIRVGWLCALYFVYLLCIFVFLHLYFSWIHGLFSRQGGLTLCFEFLSFCFVLLSFCISIGLFFFLVRVGWLCALYFCRFALYCLLELFPHQGGLTLCFVVEFFVCTCTYLFHLVYFFIRV